MMGLKNKKCIECKSVDGIVKVSCKYCGKLMRRVKMTSYHDVWFGYYCNDCSLTTCYSELNGIQKAQILLFGGWEKINEFAR